MGLRGTRGVFFCLIFQMGNKKVFSRKKIIIILDGGFVKKKLEKIHKTRSVTANMIEGLCKTEIMQRIPNPTECEIFRIYFYDAPPLEAVVQNPISNKSEKLGETLMASTNKALHRNLELTPNFAVRMGFLSQNGWELKKKVLKKSLGKNITVTENDIRPNIVQKGVDLRMGLDIAQVAIKKMADILILVAGDSDLIPAMKFARKEGLLVYLDTLGHQGVKVEMKIHADIVL